MTTARNSHSKPTKKQVVKESDVAANEAILAHAEFSQTVKSWLSIPAYGGGDDIEGENAQGGDNGGAGGTSSRMKEVLHAAGEEATSDMGGLGYIPPKDSDGRPVTATTSDPTTAFLRKHLLGSRSRLVHPAASTNRPRGGSLRGNAGSYHAAARGPGTRRANTNDDDSDDEQDSRSKARGAPSKSARGRSAKNDTAVEIEPKLRDGGGGDGSSSSTTLQTGTQAEEIEQQAHDKPSPADQPWAAMSTAGRAKRGPTSYLDQVLAERARKKKKKKK
ncbi:uncharacterized protein A1O9_03913 [Exophiala aquamarina CBS 119918]|uniref:Uncharacterized protein n=1 Tax=Exophiala aquamarina CBS 119918 TaxID=1182545 RepID=A0A072PU49_9EURO|nr:uncharacterized protein A1O9_03913 [Exophiala aquamarina CBS 119918]KEF59070.1 hypothetical protein A1O9_03913 [Exophiala aquamarina CBS 119918]